MPSPTLTPVHIRQLDLFPLFFFLDVLSLFFFLLPPCAHVPSFFNAIAFVSRPFLVSVVPFSQREARGQEERIKVVTACGPPRPFSLLPYFPSPHEHVLQPKLLRLVAIDINELGTFNRFQFFSRVCSGLQRVKLLSVRSSFDTPAILDTSLE